MNVKQSSLLLRLKGELPASPPIPGTMQTLVCRWMPLGLFEWSRRTYGDRSTLYAIDLPPVVFLSNPTDIRAVFNAPSAVLHPGAGGSAIRPIVGAHSFMLKEGREHLHLRRTILPPFNAAAIDAHRRRVTDIVRGEIGSWPVDRSFAAFPRLRSMSLRIILEAIFTSADVERLHDHVLRMLDVTASFVLVEPRLRHLPMWRGIWRRFVRERAHVDAEIYRLIESRDRSAPGADLLGRLLSATKHDGSPMGRAELRDNIMSLILAGHETTASEATWALQLIAHSPRVQARLAAEADSGGARYLRATVAEVLRHRPVFLFAIPREVAEPITIRGWTYRPPAQLLASIYLLHHDPAIYADPHHFMPERFLAQPPDTSTWIPWGGGRKRCPGHRLATLELETVIRTASSMFAITPASRRIERARWRSVIVTPARGGRLVLHRRRSRPFLTASW